MSHPGCDHLPNALIPLFAFVYGLVEGSDLLPGLYRGVLLNREKGDQLLQQWTEVFVSAEPPSVLSLPLGLILEVDFRG